MRSSLTLLLPLCAAALVATCVAGPHSAVPIFTDDELKRCTKVRIPSVAKSNSGIHVVGRCTQASAVDADGAVEFGDQVATDVVVIKSSFDGGNSWGNFAVLSPAGQQGYSNGGLIYDRIRSRLVLQYQYFPTGDTKNSSDVRTFQRFSTNEGKSWSDPPVEITEQVQPCSKSGDLDMMDISAGSKTQTSSGRLIWMAHDHSNHVCGWYSDNGGETYNITNTVGGSEVSIAELVGQPGKLYMNGRGDSLGFAPQRAQYWSDDNGATWSAPQPSQLKNDDGDGCERAVINNGRVLLTTEPKGQSRHDLVISCSKDGGKTWPYSRPTKGASKAGYSDLAAVSGGTVVVFESVPNFLSKFVDDDWCPGS